MSRRESGPIGAYMAELEGRLGVRRILSRRVLAEVRSHLGESAEELARRSAMTRTVAEREAVARFGAADELAHDLRAARNRRSSAAHRIAALWVTWAVAMAMGSATVWAAVDWQPATPTSAAGTSRAAIHVVPEIWSWYSFETLARGEDRGRCEARLRGRSPRCDTLQGKRSRR
jgi:hypothetical protein